MKDNVARSLAPRAFRTRLRDLERRERRQRLLHVLEYLVRRNLRGGKAIVRVTDRARERIGTSVAGRVLRHAGLAAGPGHQHGQLRRTLLETDEAEVLRDREPASARAGCVSGVPGLELLLRCRRERQNLRLHRSARGLQAEPAWQHLAIIFAELPQCVSDVP